MKETALITGASSGIGLELARLFARDGHDLVLVARSEDRLRQLAEELRPQGAGSVLVLAADLAQPGAAAAVEERLRAESVEVTVLVNNAGFGAYGFFHEGDLQADLQMIQVNVVALTELTRRLVAGMVARRRGRVLNVASTAAFQPGPLMAVYYATKAYVLSFSEALHGELAPKGVRVTAICPGPVPTEFQGRAGVRPGLDSKVLGVSAADVARAGFDGLMAGRRLVLPGLGMKVIPFLLRFVPRGVVLGLVSRIQRGR